jgi:hypothetical protein
LLYFAGIVFGVVIFQVHVLRFSVTVDNSSAVTSRLVLTGGMKQSTENFNSTEFEGMSKITFFIKKINLLSVLRAN